MQKHYVINMALYLHLDCVLLHMYYSEKYEEGGGGGRRIWFYGAFRTCADFPIQVNFYIMD